MNEPIWPLVLFAAVMALTPGPNVVLVTASGASFGFTRTIPSVLGLTFGFGAMAMAAGLGIAGLLQAEPRAHAALKYAGAAYLLYLAWRIAHAQAAAGSAHARPIGFLEAALFTWANPKAWVSALGALAAFTAADRSAIWQAALISCVLAVFCLLSCSIWAGLGTAIGRIIARPRPRALFNRAMAGLLVLSLIPVLRH
jgi:threonine/homoserine/homoserine lactone efflux protein